MKQELSEIIRDFYKKGWAPATSTNYSHRLDNPNHLIISRSGIDKSNFCEDDFLEIDFDENFIHSQLPQQKTSAETKIHTYLYQKFSKVNCILHTHSLYATYLSQCFQREKIIKFSGLEILKGLEGNTTHELTETIPVIPNSQDMNDIINAINPYLKSETNPHGFLISGHGLYTWGKDLFSAKRHVETFEFLFEYLCLERK